MGKLDGTGGVKAPGGFRDGKRKCPFAASWNISFQAGVSSSRTVAWETRKGGLRGEKNRVGWGGGYIKNHPWKAVATNQRRTDKQAALDTRQRVRGCWDHARFQRVRGRGGELCKWED